MPVFFNGGNNMGDESRFPDSPLLNLLPLVSCQFTLFPLLDDGKNLGFLQGQILIFSSTESQISLKPLPALARLATKSGIGNMPDCGRG
jgi:hypothetical protein